MPERALVYVHMHAPPTPGGTPVLLHRLLSGLASTRLHVVTDRALEPAVEWNGERVLPGEYHYVLRKGPRGNRWRLGRAINGVVNLTLALVAGIQAAAIVRRTGAGWVLSVADEGFSPIAGALAAGITRRPHLLMVFDLWEENAYTEFERALARRLERPFFRGAARLVVHCPEMAEHYRRKHGIACFVLPTSVERSEPGEDPVVERLGGPREVLFAGAVYWAQEDAVRRLCRVVRGLEGVTSTIVGSWADRAGLAARGIFADRLEPDLPPGDFRRRLVQADVLFLGLGFDTPHPDIVRTASPAKLPEYMASGRPILVHAPAGSHVAEYARGEGFAEVVDVPDDLALERGLLRVVGDDALARERVARALQLVTERHAVDRVRARFEELLEQVTRPECGPRRTGEGGA